MVALAQTSGCHLPRYARASYAGSRLVSVRIDSGAAQGDFAAPPRLGLRMVAEFLKLVGRIAARCVFLPRANAFHGCASGTCDLPQSFSSAVRHESEPSEGRIPDDAKPTAQPRNLTARRGNHAC